MQNGKAATGGEILWGDNKKLRSICQFISRNMHQTRFSANKLTSESNYNGIQMNKFVKKAEDLTDLVGLGNG